MRNTYSKALKKFLTLKKSLIILASKWLNSFKKDFYFYNQYTELLAIWTVLFIAITGLFFLALKSSLMIMFLLFLFSLTIMFIGVFAAIYYLHTLKYHRKNKMAFKIHKSLNASFKLRSLVRLVRFVKIPRIILNLPFKSAILNR